MKKRYFLIVMTICCITAIMAIGVNGPLASEPTAGQRPAGAPKAVVPNPVYTFDSVLEGVKVSHTYEIQNQGSDPLMISDVRTSCGCTTAEKPEIIQPGASDRIVVTANTKGYGGHAFSKTITVFTNDPKNPQIQMQIKGQVAAFAEINPSRLMIMGRTRDDIRVKTIITPNPKHPFKITEVVADERLAGKIDVQMDSHDGRYSLIVHNLLNTPGRYRGRIMLKTDNPLQPELTVFVIGQINA